MELASLDDGQHAQSVKAVVFRSPKSNLCNSRFDPMKTDLVMPESKLNVWIYSSSILNHAASHDAVMMIF